MQRVSVMISAKKRTPAAVWRRGWRGEGGLLASVLDVFVSNGWWAEPEAEGGCLVRKHSSAYPPTPNPLVSAMWEARTLWVPASTQPRILSPGNAMIGSLDHSCKNQLLDCNCVTIFAGQTTSTIPNSRPAAGPLEWLEWPVHNPSFFFSP